ncbi:MAG: hypothetical protein ACR2NZ_17315, partial [Rubripirellula sp.]
SFERPPIEYSSAHPTDAIAKLKASIDASQQTVNRDPSYGYLVGLLDALSIPVSSQALVYSKTSLQRHRISPENPRAIYFNDDVYVAWTPDADLIEIASTDSRLGSVFYTVDQQQEPTREVEITRRVHRCLFCHGSTDTGRVPGLLMQSVFTDADGHRAFPSDSIEPKANGPILGRWGGWYVTGTHGSQRHLGNLTTESSEVVLPDRLEASTNVNDLSRYFDVTRYLSPHSDLVALLVLQHQVSLHNLFTSANHQTLLKLYDGGNNVSDEHTDAEALVDETRIFMDQIAEEIVDGLLMVDQTCWSDSMSGSSDFAREFASRGPFDSKGRSLRELDLDRCLFRYPCSYLIYSDAFDGLPVSVLQRVYARLHAVLHGKDRRAKYRHLSQDQRMAIDEILVATKPAVAVAFDQLDQAVGEAEESKVDDQ